MDIILASKSKRRIEMMEEMGFPFRVVESHIAEFIDSYSSNGEIVEKLAVKKAEDVFKDNPDSLVLGFDTLVFLDNEVLGKPRDENECIEMIKKLRNRTHEVITGACFIDKNKKISFYSSCEVTFSDIDIEDIVNYSKTSEPYDKAGAYAIQGYIGRFIEKVNGDFFSVIGMPKQKVYAFLRDYVKKL
ncbi:septum formation protein Maf [bacterium]|nr:septum formation protein Maf [bacterium]